MAALRNKIQWPAPIMPLRFNYMFEPHNAETPEIKKLDHDDRILSQLLLEIKLPDQAIQGLGETIGKDMPADEVRPPVEDITLAILRPLWMKAELSLTAVITAQIMLDIINVCGNKLHRFYGQLTYAWKFTAESMEFKVGPGGRATNRTVN